MAALQGGFPRAADLLAVGGHDAQVVWFDAAHARLLRGRQKAFDQLHQHRSLYCIEVAGRLSLPHLPSTRRR